MEAVKPEVDTYQEDWELEQMVAVVERLEPKVVLEVGTMWGGTLWHWLQIADEVVSIDDEMRHWQDWERWADAADAGLTLVQGFSQDEEVIEKARELGPYDFIFIDGDHRYEPVKADWENYSPMVAPGGVFAFHDTQHIGDDTYGVERLWYEIIAEPEVRWMHFARTNHCGIGLVWL
jgi:cephalosporin hydroxylase